MVSFLIVLLLTAAALLTPSTSQEIQGRGQRSPMDTKQDSIKVVIADSCTSHSQSSDTQGKELDLVPGSPLVLTHQIKLVPSGGCGCEVDFATLRERLEELEREVSVLREKCGGAEGGCCTSKESKGAGCSIKEEPGACPNECSDQGRCVDGRCVCFPGFSGPDCTDSNCPGNCNDRGRCVSGQCECDPGFIGPDCSQTGCPDNCNRRGRCVDGKCFCDGGFTGPGCLEESCPRNCNSRGRCVEGRCECDPGFTGPDCSEYSCPSNCNSRGRCVAGRCECDPGFMGPDCSEYSCPSNCNSRGRCVEGRCECDPGFMGPDCSEYSCPSNCNSRGRCVEGRCECDPGFTGPDCSEYSCPSNCNSRGRCVKGRCECDPGFTGPDCSEDSCPSNCNSRGRCVAGRCECDPGFTGPDCSEYSCPSNCNSRGRCVAGRCECDPGFTGPDCSEDSCPSNCNSRGRCVEGRCECDPGFTGPDCSEDSCPSNCNSRGRCVEGRCECDPGFTGPDCSEYSCPSNCNSRGRCVNGQCICDGGFSGPDCSDKDCPRNCSSRGTCVKGKCVCNAGFAGPACAGKGCPNNCNSKGRCMKGKCVCRRYFTGPDCSRCEEGRTGTNCNSIMSGVSQLSTSEVTETSVTLTWTPPPVQYDTYHLTFTGQKESDLQIRVQVDGGLSSFTQTGLAPGQEYSATIRGEVDGRLGAESSAHFMTLIPGPSNLHVVKTTSTSAVVQWEPSQGEIDRYRLTIVPDGGQGTGQELTVPPHRDSAHIKQLEAGRLYDIALVAEKGTSRSEAATTQATPGTLLRVTVAPVTVRVTPTPRRDHSLTFSPEERDFDQREKRREDRRDAESVKVGAGSNEDSSSTVKTRTKPLLSRKDGFKPKVAARHMLSRKTNGSLSSNTSRVVPGLSRVGLKSPTVGIKKKAPTVSKKPKSDVPVTRGQTTPLTVRDPSPPSRERGEDKNQSDSGTKTSDESSVGVASKQQPHVGDPASPESTGTVQRNEKKCLNKIKVTHVRLAHKDRVGGCSGDETVALEKAASDPNLSSSESEDMTVKNDVPTLKKNPLSEDTESDYTPDPLDQLLTDTFDGLNITTFSLQLSKPSDVSDTKTLRKRILKALKPLRFPSSSASLTSAQSSEAPSLSSDSQASSSTAAPSPSSSSSSPSSSEKSQSGESEKPEADAKENATDPPKEPEDRHPPRDANLPVFRRTSPKVGYVRRLRQNVGPFQNRTRLLLRVPYRSPPSNTVHGPGTKKMDTPTSSSAPEGSPSVEGIVPQGDPRGDRDVATKRMSYGIEQSQKRPPAGGRRLPVSRLPPKAGLLRQPNVGPLISPSNPNLRNSLDPETEEISSPESHTSSSPLSSHKETSPAEDVVPVRDSSPAEEVVPVRDSSPAEDVVAVRDSSPAKDVVPVQDSSPAKNVVSVRDSSPAEDVVPVRDSSPAEDVVPVRNSSPAKNVVSVRDSSPAEDVVPVRDGSPVEDVVPVRDGSPVEDVAPVRDGSPAEDVAPVRDGSPAEDMAPVRDGSPVEDVVPVRDSSEGVTKRNFIAEFNQTMKRSGVPSFRPTAPKVGYSRRPSLYVGPFRNRTWTNLRPRQYPHPTRKPFQPRKPNGGRSATIQSRLLQNFNVRKIPVSQSEEENVHSPTEGVQITQSRKQGSLEVTPTGQIGGQNPTIRQTDQSGKGETVPVQTNKSGEEGTRDKDSASGSGIHKDGRSGAITQGRPAIRPGLPVKLLKRKSPTGKIRGQSATQRRNNTDGSERAEDTKRNDAPKTGFKSKAEQRRNGDSKTLLSSGVTGDVLDHAGEKNLTSEGFKIIAEEKDKNLKRKEHGGKEEASPEEEREKGHDEDYETEGGEDKDPKNAAENALPESVTAQVLKVQTRPTIKPPTQKGQILKRVLPGSDPSSLEDVPLQKEYTLTFLGNRRGLLPGLNKLVISTGPEPPSSIVFSEVTEKSVTVSWTKPKSPVSGFKVTYTHTEDGEPMSVSVDSEDSALHLSQLSPGSSYEVSVVSISDLDESDPIRDFVTTLPDPPADLRVVNITDTKALLLWRPAMAAADHYAIVYGTDKDQNGSALRITVSGSAAEQQLSGLEGSTTYTVTISSQLGGLDSPPAATRFTTHGSGRDAETTPGLQVSQVTPRTAMLSWKPPSNPVGSYRLTYQAEGQEMKEVTVEAPATEFNLTRLHPGTTYTVQLQAAAGGRYPAAEFTTGLLRFPFPSDCSQELLNGIVSSGVAEIFPHGKDGVPVNVYCDMETDGGGWTVFQRRRDGSVDFFRRWKEYVRGFGDLSGEFWLGLESLHNLTTTTRMSLRVDLRNGDEAAFAKYSTFQVASRNYKLSVSGYSGTAGDSLSYHNNQIFSTKDWDQTPFITRCAMSYRGGWWYKNCHEANLNGLYGTNVRHQGVIWTSWKGKDFSVPFTEMKMRPAAFRPPARG